MRRAAALIALASHLAAAIALPLLHERHHARHGADHVHTAHGTYALHLEAHHAAFHRDLEALGLAEVAHAGALEVDCALAELTLARCDDPGAHRSFGDELAADEAPAAPPFDPEHGRGAIEHLSASLLPAAPLLLPPPPAPHRLPCPPDPRVRPCARAVAPHARGPPAIG